MVVIQNLKHTDETNDNIQNDGLDGMALTESVKERTKTLESHYRPTTRSQTSHTLKRSNDSLPSLDENKNSNLPLRKRSKPSQNINTGSNVIDVPFGKYTTNTQPTTTIKSNPVQLTFLQHESSSSNESLARRSGIRTRVVLPVPVPNLTKKSRGRRVPTRPQNEANQDQKDKEMRTYTCIADGCGKCFYRGEHLKRHIRSIHTHEKPFKCTYPMCEKYFNRHDNLLQHLKVHRDDAQAEVHLNDTTSPYIGPTEMNGSSNTHTFTIINTSSMYNSSSTQQGQKYHSPMQYPLSPRYALSPDSIVNMAVSSLRTELPQSPPISHLGDHASPHRASDLNTN